MKEKNIQELAIRMGLITVEDMCQYTIAQLVVKIANKVNELVNEVWRFESDVQEILKTQNENIQYLLGEGLNIEVENIFDGWVKDGTFDTLINQKALKKVNKRIDETNAQLTNYAKKEDVAKISSGTPLFASSTTEMTDTTRNYVNTTDGYLYIYNGNNFEKTSIQYQSAGIADNYITTHMMKGLVDFTDINRTVKNFIESEMLRDENLTVNNTILNVNSGNVILRKSSVKNAWMSTDIINYDIQFVVEDSEFLVFSVANNIQAIAINLGLYDSAKFGEIVSFSQTASSKLVDSSTTGSVKKGDVIDLRLRDNIIHIFKNDSYFYAIDINELVKNSIMLQERLCVGFVADVFSSDVTVCSNLKKVKKVTTNNDNLLFYNSNEFLKYCNKNSKYANWTFFDEKTTKITFKLEKDGEFFVLGGDDNSVTAIALKNKISVFNFTSSNATELKSYTNITPAILGDTIEICVVTGKVYRFYKNNAFWFELSKREFENNASSPIFLNSHLGILKNGTNFKTGTLISQLEESKYHMTIDGAYKNKTWCAIGDSFTWLDGYTKIVAECLGMSYVNHGHSGYTIGDMHNGMLVTDNYGEADIYTVFGGTNDFHLNVPLGQRTDTKKGTFYGDLYFMIRSMTNAHKDKRLVFITPTQRDGYILNGKVTSMTNDIGVNLIQYVDAMIEMCGDYGIPVIDLYRNSGINTVNIPTMLYDGLHPNTDGFLRIGYYIAKQLNNI